MVEERFRARKTLVIKDANAIRTAFLRAGMIPEPHGTRVKELLREYLKGRLGIRRENLKERLQQAEILQRALWTHAEAVGNQHPNSETIALFVESLNDVISLHEERLATAIHHRLPITILGALVMISLLAIGSLGLSSGLTRSRSPLPTFVIILAIVVVETLIVDLDRPLADLFKVSHDALVELQETVVIK
jgi:hypothetical protein